MSETAVTEPPDCGTSRVSSRALAAVVDPGRTRGQLRRARRARRLLRPRAAGARPGRRGLHRRHAAEQHRARRAVLRRHGVRAVHRADQLAPDRPRGRLHRRGLRGEGLRRPRAIRRAPPPSPRRRLPDIGALRRRRGRRLPPAGRTGRPRRTAGRTARQGAPMVYTSGTTGKPKGVKRPLTGADPDDVPLAAGVLLRRLPASTPSTTTCTSAARRSITRRCSTSSASRSSSGTPSC